MGIGNLIKGSLLVTGIGGLIYAGLIKPEITNERFIKTYNQTLLKYADTNNDRVISTVEERNFIKLLQDKEVTLRHDGRLVYRYNGEEVPMERITQWIKEYQPEK